MYFPVSSGENDDFLLVTYDAIVTIFLPLILILSFSQKLDIMGPLRVCFQSKQQAGTSLQKINLLNVKLHFITFEGHFLVAGEELIVPAMVKI